MSTGSPVFGAGRTVDRRRALAAGLASLTVHALAVALFVAAGGLGPHLARHRDRAIALVSLQNFVSPPPSPAPLAAAPSPPPAPLPRPQAKPAEPSEPAAKPPDESLLHEDLSPAAPGGGGMTAATGGDEDYVPQFKVTEAPVIPIREVLSRIEYPPLAAKQGIEATVYLELYIDSSGRIRRATVLKDPGFGFAEAATRALVGVVCVPAKADGQAVAVRFRYPVRFTLK